MWAMMPMFRVLFSATCRGIDLPTIVGERLVRLRHPMRVFAFLHRAAAEVRGIEQLVRELLLHRLAIAAGAGIANQPTNAEREPPVGIDLDRHLVVRAADAPRLHLEAGLHVVDGLL